MAKVATDFMKRHKWTFETPSSELAQYTEEISKSLKDDCKVRSNAKTRFRALGLTKEQVEVLIPIRPTGKREEGRDTVDKIAQEIVENDYQSEKIKQISYDLGSSAPNPVAGRSRLTLLRKKLQDRGANHLKKEATKIPHITTEANKIQARRLVLDEDEGVDWPEHFLLEPVQERLEKCDFSLSPSKEDLVDVMIMLSMRPADVATLRIDKYEASDEIWYDPKYSWNCTGYSKTKEETGVGEPRPFLSMEKDPIRAKEFLAWIQKAIPEKFTFLRKNKSGIVNVDPINLILAKHGITSNKLRKIGADHASRIHRGKNDSRHQRLRKLACRQVVGRDESVQHYGIMNDPPSSNCSKGSGNQTKIKKKMD
ncbi:uncharacterized protein OCT59_001159 [Rhizophagus irregularis]|uniref:Uncharacterized protein n=1 Tax=Rhizophagus irregularis (strain DAOM 197198w) TaxID=1432141 RepID=A0A015JBA1_RHIIW|nr:hypothetical protein RirG_255320 [Rhizophagus irregularis DAOM 197198w]UZN99896.1 hypothetical protein OCT59_001159 [Rhizophagus irregularis]